MKIHPGIAAATFVLGLLLGLYAAEEEHAEVAAYSTAALAGMGASLRVCQTANTQWQAYADAQDRVLEHQAALLREVGPIVRRAYPRWAWSPEQEATR